MTLRRVLILILKATGFLVGALFLAYWIRKMGVAQIVGAMKSLRWSGVVLVLANSFFWYLSYTKAWHSYFLKLSHKISFFHLLKVKFCGESVNLLTPLNFVLGDPVRAIMLKKHLGAGTRMGSVLVDRVLHSHATVFCVFLGVGGAMLVHIPMPKGVLPGVFALYFLMNVFFVMVIWNILKGKGLSQIYPLIKRVPFIGKKEGIKEWFDDLNEELTSYAGNKAWFLLKPFGYHFLGRVLGGLEISIILYFMVGAPHFIFGFVMAGLTAAGNLLFAFIPGGLGVIESLYAYVFSTLGMGPQMGVALQLIRRLRSVFWIIFGYLLLNLTEGNLLRHNKEKIPS